MVRYTVKVYHNKTEWYREGKLDRENGPAVEWNSGNKLWYKNGLLNRVDGPAIKKINGTEKWYVNGRLHREDGPAIIYANGDKSWWTNGIQRAVQFANSVGYLFFENNVRFVPAKYNE